MCSPQVGSFVVFSLDPISMVERFCNPSLTHACQNLKMGKYVAYISQVISPYPSTHVSAALHFVFQGTSSPTFDWIEGIQQDMAIPVLPNTRHPSRRPPLDPGVPLPWNSCSISPLVVTWAKVAPSCRSP
ncbi:hypothetical protein BT96DRAFT_822092 [Gymnopus androsaceus JB14]|uniref:Uncharacterized protein n=1 Tax=Gymnopus androsaceus JB14 TaxID=1447944 RepID=A0A6A4HMR5_9AGAR|nr:hypothetical protein BT96DRAFT_822092 [Gymnopus androsaceus JB14]